MATVGRWRRRGAAADDASALDPEVVGALRATHLLLVPTTASVDDVSDLLRARVPLAGDLAKDGEVALGRHSRLTGPYILSMEDAVAAGVPLPWTVVYALEAPVEREDPPLAGVDDRDGFAQSFPGGLPWREEGRTLGLLVAMARRVGGAVRIGGPGGGPDRLVQPDPHRAVDHVVHSPFWVEPGTLLGVVTREVPTARLAAEGETWQGPAESAYTGALILSDLATEVVDPTGTLARHATSGQVDKHALGAPDPVDAYAVIAPLGPGGHHGAVEVLVHVADPDEPAARHEDWGGRPFVTYEVRWLCSETDAFERERRVPDERYLAVRSRVAPVVVAVTRAVVEATSGIVTDEDGFWLDRYRL
jgi:hypothetical protein